MSWKCFFGHNYKIRGAKNLETYGEDRDLPLEIDTRFLYKCTRCDHVTVLVVEGAWAKDTDDDGGDDDHPGNVPVCPDDYFELLAKK